MTEIRLWLERDRRPLRSSRCEVRHEQVLEVSDGGNLRSASGVDMHQEVGGTRSCHEHLANMWPTVWGIP